MANTGKNGGDLFSAIHLAWITQDLWRFFLFLARWFTLYLIMILLLSVAVIGFLSAWGFILVSPTTGVHHVH